MSTITNGTNGIELVRVEDMVVSQKGRPKGSTGTRFGKYIEATRPLMVWIRNEISNSRDGIIRMREADLAAEMSNGYTNFVDKKVNTVYWGLKNALKNEGIGVGTVTLKTGEKAIVMKLVGSGS